MIGPSSVLTVPLKKPDVGSVNAKESSMCVIGFRRCGRSGTTRKMVNKKFSARTPHVNRKPCKRGLLLKSINESRTHLRSSCRYCADTGIC